MFDFIFLVTECGFGADIGMEKFFNIKCRYSGRFQSFCFSPVFGERIGDRECSSFIIIFIIIVSYLIIKETNVLNIELTPLLVVSKLKMPNKISFFYLGFSRSHCHV